ELVEALRVDGDVVGIEADRVGVFEHDVGWKKAEGVLHVAHEAADGPLVRRSEDELARLRDRSALAGEGEVDDQGARFPVADRQSIAAVVDRGQPTEEPYAKKCHGRDPD